MMKNSVFCLVNVLFCVTYWNIYIYIVQIAKRHTSPALAFSMQILPNILPDLVLHVESKHRTCASLRYLYNIDKFQYVTQTRTFTRQITLLVIILVLITRYMLVLGVHVCHEVI